MVANDIQFFTTILEAQKCADRIFMHFFDGVKKGYTAEKYNIMGSMNAPFIAMMFTAVGHALLDWRTGERITGGVFNHVKCIGAFLSIRSCPSAVRLSLRAVNSGVRDNTFSAQVYFI